MATRASSKKRATKKASKKKAVKGVKLKGQVATGKTLGGKKIGLGHNGGPKGLTDDQIEVQLKRLDRLLSDAERDKRTARSSMTTFTEARKEAKGLGINVDAYKIMKTVEKQDMGVVHTNYADAGHYLKVMKSKLAEDIDLFQNLEAPKPIVDVALQGLNAGKNGEPIDNCPYNPGTENYIKWRDNWEVGQEQVREGLKG